MPSPGTPTPSLTLTLPFLLVGSLTLPPYIWSRENPSRPLEVVHYVLQSPNPSIPLRLVRPNHPSRAGETSGIREAWWRLRDDSRESESQAEGDAADAAWSLTLDPSVSPTSEEEDILLILKRHWFVGLRLTSPRHICMQTTVWRSQLHALLKTLQEHFNDRTGASDFPFAVVLTSSCRPSLSVSSGADWLSMRGGWSAPMTCRLIMALTGFERVVSRIGGGVLVGGMEGLITFTTFSRFFRWKVRSIRRKFVGEAKEAGCGVTSNTLVGEENSLSGWLGFIQSVEGEGEDEVREEVKELEGEEWVRWLRKEERLPRDLMGETEIGMIDRGRERFEIEKGTAEFRGLRALVEEMGRRCDMPVAFPPPSLQPTRFSSDGEDGSGAVCSEFVFRTHRPTVEWKEIAAYAEFISCFVDFCYWTPKEILLQRIQEFHNTPLQELSVRDFLDMIQVSEPVIEFYCDLSSFSNATVGSSIPATCSDGFLQFRVAEIEKRREHREGRKHLAKFLEDYEYAGGFGHKDKTDEEQKKLKRRKKVEYVQEGVDVEQMNRWRDEAEEEDEKGNPYRWYEGEVQELLNDVV